METAILEIRAWIESDTSRPSGRRAERYRSFDFHSPFVWRPDSAAVSSVLAALLFTASGTAAAPTATPSGKIWQSDGSAANIQRIHDRQASDGDTITIPKGTFSWTTYLILTKKITIQGQTTTNAPSSSTSNDLTIIQDNLSRSTDRPMIMLNSPGGQRISGITFTVGTVTQPSNYSVIDFGVGASNPIRIDHVVNNTLYRNNFVTAGGTYNYGVVDHCVLHAGGINVDPANGGGPQGDEAWAAPTGFGGPNFFFVEDNNQDTSSSPNAIAAIANITAGGKVVVRHNVIKGNTILLALHSIGMTSPWRRSGRASEVYNNTVTQTKAGTDLAGSTGGPTYWYNNTFVGSIMPRAIDLGYYRTIQNFGSPFYGADGQNAWDYNVTESDGTHVDGHPPYLFDSGTLSAASGSTITDSTKNWSTNRWRGYSIRRPSDGATAVISSNTNNTLSIGQWQSQGFAAGNTYEIHKAIRVLDQPGLGAQIGTMNRNNPRWMQQATEPCYSWNNKDQNNNLVNFITASSGATIIEGRDYFNNTPMPGYTPYTYPHPLTTSLPPPQPRAGSPQQVQKKRKKWGQAKGGWGKPKKIPANEMAQPEQ